MSDTVNLLDGGGGPTRSLALIRRSTNEIMIEKYRLQNYANTANLSRIKEHNRSGTTTAAQSQHVHPTPSL
jgi:hypothetical protein